MKFLSIYKSAERAFLLPRGMSKMGQLIEKEMKAGTLLATEGCLAKRSRRARSHVWWEADRDRWAVHRGQGSDRRLRHPPSKLEGRGHRNGQEFLQVAGDGECELRQVYEADQNTCAEAAATR